MSRLATRSVVREEFGDGDWVAIRHGLTQGEMLDIATGATGPDGQMLAGTVVILQMLAAIESWDGPGFIADDGTAIPVTIETLRQLTVQDGARLVALINKHNQPVGEDEKKDAGSGITDSSNPAGAD